MLYEAATSLENGQGRGREVRGAGIGRRETIKMTKTF